jgi:hypothetical protein
MKKWIPVVIAFLLLLGGIWFWSLGSLPKSPPNGVVLKNIAGLVSVKAAGAGSFQRQMEDTVLEAGSVVRTDANSSAIIDYFGLAESELDQNSELVIREATSIEESGSLSVKLTLGAGRVWSRVMHILDLDGEFTVQTSDVVATVRGTSFDVAVQDDAGTTLWVADSVIEADGEEAVYVPEGHMLRFTKGKPEGDLMPISDNGKSSDWFKNNQTRDRNFAKRARERIFERVGAERLAPSGMMRDVAKGSEAMRKTIGSDEKKEMLEESYFLRRLAYIRLEIDGNRLGSAGKELAKLRSELEKTVSHGGREAMVARRAMHVATPLFYDLDPTTEAYSLKQQFEALMIGLAEDDPKSMMMRLMTVQSRLGEAKTAFATNDFGEAEQILGLAKQAHRNASREMAGIASGPNELAKLKKYMTAIEVRMTHFERALEETKRGALLRSSGRGNETATSTKDALELFCEDLRVTLTPDPLEVGQTATIRVEALLSDGSEEDVTSVARLSMNSSVATLVNGSVRALEPGNATIAVFYECRGREITKDVSVRVEKSAQ